MAIIRPLKYFKPVYNKIMLIPEYIKNLNNESGPYANNKLKGNIEIPINILTNIIV